MTDDQKTTVKGYVTTFNSDITAGALLDLVVDSVADRVLLYLNETQIADNLLRVIAQVVVDVFAHTEAPDNNSISSVSDNGQTVSYHLRPQQYLASTSDQELFLGFEKLLSSYRRIHVITN